MTSELPGISRHVYEANPTFVEDVNTLKNFFLLGNEDIGHVLMFSI